MKPVVSTLDPWDWVTLCTYLVVSISIGLLLSGKNKNLKDFFFGGGRVPWFAVGVSLIATSVSANTFINNPSDSYSSDMRYLTLQFGAFISFFIVAYIFIPRLRSSGIQSAYEYLEIKFSRSVRILASSLYCLHILLRVGILIYIPSSVLTQVVNIDIKTAILITATISTFYTYLGGIRAVIWTDLIQFIVLMGGGLFVLWHLSSSVDGFSNIIQIAGETDKTTWIDFRLNIADEKTFISAGLAYIVLEVALRGCDQQFVQRYLSCESTTKANLSSFVSVILGTVISLMFFFIGLGLYAYYQKGYGSLPSKTDNNVVFPYFIVNELPVGFAGVLIAAIFAAAMSSLDSAVSALSNTSVVDLFPSKNNEDTMRKTKKFVLFWGILGAGAAFLCDAGQDSLLKKALFFTSLFTGPLLAMFLFAFFFPKLKSRSVIIGVIGGMIFLMLLSKIPIPMPIDQLNLGFAQIIDGQWTPAIQFSWPWNPLIALSGTFLFTFIAHLFLGQDEAKLAS